ncbi:MAG: hypothetical protein R3344_03770 [Acidobacteriota bacterium]|nr:hypothetical protein [Acidobacteriota bacterium]
MTPSQLIAFLNAMSCGDLDSLAAKLDEARCACEALDQTELAMKLYDARGALLDGDLKSYRKSVETVVARLGHLKARQATRAS